jgi:hypothetical protein
MALKWDLTKVKDWEKIEPHVRDGMIWYSMFIGWGGQLTEENAEDAWHRIAFHQKVHGTLYKQAGTDLPLTREQVYSMIGMGTNTAPITKSQFVRIVYNTFADGERRQRLALIAEPLRTIHNGESE